MSRRPSKPCAVTWCQALVEPPERYCHEHRGFKTAGGDSGMSGKEPDSRTTTERGYGYNWQRVRKAKIYKNPLCEECGDLATEVHHIKPIEKGGTNAFSNLMSVCRTCHNRIAAREKHREKRRIR